VYPAIDSKIHFENKTFKGKVVLVTGASRGIGADISLYFAKAGASVAILSRKQETLDDTKNAILAAEAGAQVLTCVADVVDYVAAEAAVSEVIKRFGRLDILVTNAGTLTPMGQRTLDLPGCFVCY
jgi:NAD(P)-dependent dehydrogenase (short-subunit alcohol dehydrogenase family)